MQNLEKSIILGYAPYAGEFEGRAYSGIRVYVQLIDKAVEAGIATDVIKFTSKVLASLPICFTPDVIGCVLGVGYDRYGKINYAEIQKEGEK